MSEHVHQHVPEELHEPADTATRRARLLEVVGVVMLSIAAVGTAWSGYQAARWSGLEAHDFAHADALHSRSTRALTRAGQDRAQDLSDFERWLDLVSLGNQPLADLHALHFRPELRVAFDAWLAQDPLNNAAAIPTPLKMPEYRPAESARAADLEKDADHTLEAGATARDRADEYVLTTVFFASVLFFSGISMRIRSIRLRTLILAIGTAFLVYGAVQLILLPTRW
jgi:hypothetical protein